MTRRCGFVALVGAPNAGKSTLLNAAVRAKVSIVTHKVQTTRVRVRGIAIEGESQIVFIDTPGIFSTPRRRLERAMVGLAWQAVAEADIVLLLHDARRPAAEPETTAMLAGLKQRARRLVLVLNKIDTLRRERLLELAREFGAAADFERVFMVSALTGDGLPDLLRWLAETVPEGAWLFPEDQLSDLPERLLAAEITREKLFLNLHQELPYALTVETDAWEPFKDGSLRIEQTIYVEREAQKKIAIGAGGATIRKVRQAAQRELEAMLDRKVHLFLFVKVRERWAEDPGRVRALGLDFES